MEQVKQVVDILKKGGLAIFPTDTVYGLGGCADSKLVIEKIYRLKQRDKKKPLIIFIPNKKYIKKLGVQITAREKKLIKAFWPGAVTFIFKRVSHHKKDKIAVRIPDHPVVLKILQGIKRPLVVTSANTSGEKSPVDFPQIGKSLLEKVDIVLNRGKCLLKKESTIVDVSGEKIEILRKGAISKKKIMEVMKKR